MFSIFMNCFTIKNQKLHEIVYEKSVTLKIGKTKKEQND